MVNFTCNLRKRRVVKMVGIKKVISYFLSLVREEEGDVMTNLRLQKLLYYAQAFHLAMNDEPLFKNKIEAWVYGPVVPDVFNKYKDNEDGIIRAKEASGHNGLSDDIRELLDEVYIVYGQFSASALIDISHSEPPWYKTPIKSEISHEVMKEFFRGRLNNSQLSDT